MSERTVDRRMIRYSKPKDNIKNTLVTNRIGNFIFFGISRCNKDKGDAFNKQRGVMIAEQRALLAEEDTELEQIPETNIQVQHSWLRGKVHRDNVVQLLAVFDNIDGILFNKSTRHRR